jgi:hypothetical protein
MQSLLTDDRATELRRTATEAAETIMGRCSPAEAAAFCYMIVEQLALNLPPGDGHRMIEAVQQLLDGAADKLPKLQ